MDDLWLDGASAVEIAAAVRRGDVSAAEITDAVIDRIEHRDNAVHAVVIPLFERARARARAVGDAAFAGVPMLLKDAGQELAGTPTWVGVAALREAGFCSVQTTQLAARFEQL